MAKPTKYELLYNSIKSILLWHVLHEKKEHAKEAYSSTLNQMKKLEALGGEGVEGEIKKIFINGEPVQ